MSESAVPPPVAEPTNRDPLADLGSLTDRVFAAVLFDLDGTLIDSTPAVERSWRQWATEFGLDDLTGYGSWHGVPATQTVRVLLPEDRWKDGVARLAELELADVADLRALPGAAAGLTALAHGPAAIVTSCIAELAAVRLRATGLTPPAVLVTADQVPIGKPDPAPFLLAARRLGVDPADCLAVEDAPAGLTSARAAGCARLAVSTTHNADQLDADAVVTDLSAVRFTLADGGVRVSVI